MILSLLWVVTGKKVRKMTHTRIVSMSSLFRHKSAPMTSHVCNCHTKDWKRAKTVSQRLSKQYKTSGRNDEEIARHKRGCRCPAKSYKPVKPSNLQSHPTHLHPPQTLLPETTPLKDKTKAQSGIILRTKARQGPKKKRQGRSSS